MDMPNQTSLRGWVYVLTNEGMPGLVKVGYSGQDPILRARELSGTGVPYPSEVAFDTLVVDPKNVERLTHEALADKRVSENREWFRCSVLEARAVIEAVTSGKQLPGPRRANLLDTGTVSVSTTWAKKTGPWEDPARTRNSSSTQWEFSRRALLLRHKSTGQTFQAGEYTYDGDGTLKGFALRNKQTPWVRLEDVEFTD